MDSRQLKVNETHRRPTLVRRQGIGGPSREGFFLLMVLVVIAIATLAVYTFTETMIVLDDAAYLQSGGVQSQASVESAVAMIQTLLSASRDERDAIGGLYNNPAVFAGQSLQSLEGSPGEDAFSVLATGLDTQGRPAGLRYGLIDESTRLNINTLAVLDANSDLLMPAMIAINGAGSSSEFGEVDSENLAVTMLMALPGMTLDIADAILDWIDEDTEPRDLGAESETYATLPQPYEPADGPIESVDELLLVRGVTPTLLYGADSNRNGVLDADEQQRFGVSIETSGALGWASMLTASSLESPLGPEGSPRIDINGDDLEVVYDELLSVLDDPDYASFIVAYRIAGEAPQDAASVDVLTGGISEDDPFDDASVVDGGIWSSDLLDQMDLTGGGQPIGQILDLVGATVTIGEGQNQVRYQSPLLDDPVLASSYLTILMDELTASGTDPLPGRLNINACSSELLVGVPTLTTEQVDSILDIRDPSSLDPVRRHATWLYSEGIVDLQQMRLLMPIICGGGDLFRAQIVGYRVNGGAFSRWEIMLDASTLEPQVVSRRNLSHLGRGFQLTDLSAMAN